MRHVHTTDVVFATVWIAFWIYWIVAAFFTKRGRVEWSHELRIRVLVIILAGFALRGGGFRDSGHDIAAWRIGLGFALFAVGLGFAVWARLHIGRNWGHPMSKKENPELITSGPYQLVRHPIYFGILLAGAGTAVALNWAWLIATAIAGVYFIYSATVEERNLTEQFPDAYPNYTRTTKMLVPFIY